MIDKFLRESIGVWTPDYPRRVSHPDAGRDWGQMTAHGPEEVLEYIKAGSGDAPGFVSVNSFPNGHPSDPGENIPRSNTLMIDFDLEDGGDTKLEWKYQLQALLDQITAVAETLVENGSDKYWRASLSGHKGVHLYLDYETVGFANAQGNFGKFENGMEAFLELVLDRLEESSGVDDIREFYDCSSGSDLSRLTRLPNTIHEGATERFGETRFCVPVSVKELADVDTVADYTRLTRRPHSVPDRALRVESQNARESLILKIHKANGGSSRGVSEFSAKRVEQYDEEVANQDLTLDHLLNISLRSKPCIKAWRENPDEMFAHGFQSHRFELSVLTALKNLNAPKAVMHEFMSVAPEYDEQETERNIAKVVGNDYGRKGEERLEGGEEYAGTDNAGATGFNCETIHEDSPEFCLGSDCSFYQREFADDPGVQITN